MMKDGQFKPDSNSHDMQEIFAEGKLILENHQSYVTIRVIPEIKLND
jgi:hypothetical protein